ncbi:MAG: sugar ABC transporter permease [Cyanobacteria bacterium P01_F01_bin.53]
MNDNVSLIFRALLAIALGSGGVIGIFYALNILAEKVLPQKTRDKILPWIYTGPAVLLLTTYLVFPTLRTAYLSFFNGNSTQFVGLKNYLFVLTAPDTLIIFRNNLLWLVLVTGLSVGMGLIIAVLIDRVKYEATAKSLIFLPMAISFVGASVIWRFIYAYRPIDSEQIGLLNAIVTAFGFEPVGWLVTPGLNTFALIVIMIWLQTGFCMVLLSSAVKGVPKDVIEAARVDGANEVQIFRSIIVPMIMPTVMVVATTVLVSVLKVFDIVFVMTGGNLKTDVIASRMVKEMFNFREFGRGSAIALILLMAVIPVMVANIRRFRQQELNR